VTGALTRADRTPRPGVRQAWSRSVSKALQTSSRAAAKPVARIGASGTKHLVGLLEPDQGEVLIFGRDLWKISEKERDELRTRMGVPFQDGALFGSLNVYDISGTAEHSCAFARGPELDASRGLGPGPGGPVFGVVRGPALGIATTPQRCYICASPDAVRC
jgi:hypothetical protein